MRGYPLKLESRSDLSTSTSGFDVVLLAFGFDSASANLKAFKHLTEVIERSGLDRVVIHGERCAMHQVHIAKAGCVDVAGMAAMLYSSSKLLRSSSCLNGVRDGIHHFVARSFRVLYNPAPAQGERHEFLEIATLVFGIDGESHFLQRWHGGRLVPTPFMHDLLELCSKVRFDRPSGEWQWWAFAPDGCSRNHRGRMSSADIDIAITDTTAMVQNVLVGCAWPVAALSRWTQVIDGLKRIVFGAALGGGVFIRCLARLGAGIDEGSVHRDLEASARLAAQGLEAEDGHTKHCARILRVARFWESPERPWQAAIVLICTSVIDKLSQKLLGKDHKKVTLTDLVDPGRSLVAQTASQYVELLRNFAGDSPWRLIGFVGPEGWHDEARIRKFARRQILSLSCGLFRRLTLRFREFPYRLQFFCSGAATQADRQTVCDEFFALPSHCLSVSARRLRTIVQSPLALMGPKGRQLAEMLDRTLTFSTHPVEVDHKAPATKLHRVGVGGGASGNLLKLCRGAWVHVAGRGAA